MYWIELSIDTPNEFVEPISQIFLRYANTDIAIIENIEYHPDEGETKPNNYSVTIKTYIEEKELFQENAKCSLVGTADNMYGMDYDSSTGILHTGNNYGRSDFRKLIRIKSTTRPLVQTSQHNIAAEGGIVAEQITT